jgi:hypothetical protein
MKLTGIIKQIAKGIVNYLEIPHNAQPSNHRTYGPAKRQNMRLWNSVHNKVYYSLTKFPGIREVLTPVPQKNALSNLGENLKNHFN